MSQVNSGYGAATHGIAGRVISMSRNETPLSAAAASASLSAAAGRQLPTDEELREIATSLRGMRYGSVSIVVQDGVIIQIDRTEKRRLRNHERNNNGRS
jgi:hypothetical protein